MLSAETAEAAKDPFEGYTFVKQLGVGLTGSVYKCWKPNVSKAGVQDKEKPYVAVAVKVMEQGADSRHQRDGARRARELDHESRVSTPVHQRR